jgi:hypothetical protein
LGEKKKNHSFILFFGAHGLALAAAQARAHGLVTRPVLLLALAAAVARCLAATATEQRREILCTHLLGNLCGALRELLRELRHGLALCRLLVKRNGCMDNIRGGLLRVRLFKFKKNLKN